ncbi:FtsW/RodA/SpoVE family cell cycle protein [Anaerosoma tenue]|uniref:FtsW/RodA/SpoVE family cell cycle protein n=1 Tax=Anaerosoma tenue TaxID=2933588 RepID=UPI002260B16A|nr:putative peptidoglycan glycosyltransferase FtsW [Anaerosoma tenue]MCK8114368.1 putative lipid II flippase FtsW [Anaerosoma tenue]
MTRRPRTLTRSGYWLLGSTVALVLAGILMVYSASSVADYVAYGDSAFHLKKQALFAAIGFVALLIASFWDFRSRRGELDPRRPDVVAWGVWAVAFVGLLMVEIMGVGKWGATRSIDLGFAYVQPSEYAKLGCLLVTAVLVVAWRKGALDTGPFLGWLAAAVVPTVVLIMMQPDMGTTVSLVVGVFLLLVLGGLPARWLVPSAVGGATVAFALVWAAGYRMERVTSFLDPWADPSDGGYQIIQSLYAFGSGGIDGIGLGLSRQKYFYLPAAHTDFIFAVIGEEMGLIGSLAIVIAFGIFAYAGFRVAWESRDLFGKLLAGGLTAMIVVQALMNMAAVTGLMPITGIPLPLVSAGGSSLTLTLACVGLILAVSRYGGQARVRLVRPGRTRGSKSAGSVERRRDGRTHLSGVDGGRPTARRGA